MSEKRTTDWVVYDEYGDNPKTITVVYYASDAVCPACKGAGYLPHDNRLTIDPEFDESGQQPIEDICHVCEFEKKVEIIDRKRMTEIQLELYDRYVAHKSEVNEISKHL